MMNLQQPGITPCPGGCPSETIQVEHEGLLMGRYALFLHCPICGKEGWVYKETLKRYAKTAEDY